VREPALRSPRLIIVLYAKCHSPPANRIVIGKSSATELPYGRCSSDPLSIINYLFSLRYRSESLSSRDTGATLGNLGEDLHIHGRILAKDLHIDAKHEYAERDAFRWVRVHEDYGLEPGKVPFKRGDENYRSGYGIGILSPAS
jgi:hypothetical protein